MQQDQQFHVKVSLCEISQICQNYLIFLLKFWWAPTRTRSHPQEILATMLLLLESVSYTEISMQYCLRFLKL